MVGVRAQYYSKTPLMFKGVFVLSANLPNEQYMPVDKVICAV